MPLGIGCMAQVVPEVLVTTVLRLVTLRLVATVIAVVIHCARHTVHLGRSCACADIVCYTVDLQLSLGIHYICGVVAAKCQKLKQCL